MCKCTNSKYKSEFKLIKYAEGKDIVQIKKEFKDTIIEVFQLSPALITHGGPGSITIHVIKK